MADNSDKAKDAILAAFRDDESGDEDFLVANKEPTVEVKPLSVDEKYVFL